MEIQLSKSMEGLISRAETELGTKLSRMLRECLLDTLERTMKPLEDQTTYAITGDIPAMWLRDSSAQIRPYLMFAGEDEKLCGLVAGLVRRQFFYINIDPYANAFNETPSGDCWAKDKTKENPWVWERKFELDSLCYPVQLAYLLWKNTGCTAQFDENFRMGTEKILQVFQREQNHEELSDYRFERENTYFQDTLSREGRGALVKPETGLIFSGFRPSDDACTYGYLIPSNMFAAVILGYIEEIAKELLKDSSMQEKAGRLKETVTKAIETYGITKKEGFGRIYAYEADGFGQYLLMDDANVPSLLSMEYLGYEPRDKEVAENTRRFLLSDANPYYFKGEKAAGIGSPHTPAGYVWHIALAMEGLTAETKGKKKEILDLLSSTDGGTGRMHEGFHVDCPKKYTREWFSWADSMFCELALDYLGYRVKR